jgi:RNA polymerase sigma factor (sigma-70 family)
LVRRYEAAVRLEVRMSLRDRRLGRVLDSMDVCQSVLASFFVRAALGQYELRQPADLIRLLVTMARNKLASHARKQGAQKRDVRRTVEATADMTVSDPAPSPSEQVAGRELLQRFRELLTEDEQRLADWRAEGRTWADIADETGENAKALCKRLARAADRVSRQLGLVEEDEAEQEEP